MRKEAYITDASGIRINGLLFNSGESRTIRIYVPTGTTQAYIRAMRADFVQEQLTGEDDSTALGNGQELIDDGIIEGRLSGGIWQNICKRANQLDLGAIADGTYKEVEIRVLEDTTLSTVGVVGIGFLIECLNV